MCYVKYFLTLCFFALPSSSSPLEDQDVNLNLETRLEFNRQSVETDVKIIDKVQNFLSKVKGVLDESRTTKRDLGDGRRRNSPRSPPHFTFTDFLQRVLQVLATFDDEHLQTMVSVFDDEARRYHYEGCKFYELLHHPTLRRQIAYTLNTMKRMPIKALKEVMNRWQKKIEKKRFTENEQELYDFLDTLYDENSRQEMIGTLDGLESYRRQGANTWVTQSPGKMVKIIRSALQNIIFNQYSKLNNNVRKDLKLKIASFFVLQSAEGEVFKIGYITKTTKEPTKQQKDTEVVSTTEKAKKKKKKINKAKESKLKKVEKNDVDTDKLKDNWTVRFISLYTEDYNSKATKHMEKQAGLQTSTKPTAPTDTAAMIAPHERSHGKGTRTISTTSTTTAPSTEKKKKKHKKHKESKPKSIKNYEDDSGNNIEKEREKFNVVTKKHKAKRPERKKTLPTSTIQTTISTVDPNSRERHSSREKTKMNEESNMSENEDVSSKGDQTGSSAASSSRDGSKDSQDSVFTESDELQMRAHRSKNKEKNKERNEPKTASGKKKLPLHEIFMQYNAVVNVERSPSLKRSTVKTKHGKSKSKSKIKRKREHAAHTTHRFRSVVSKSSDPKEHDPAGMRVRQMQVFKKKKFYRNKKHVEKVPKLSHTSRRANIIESDLSSKGLSIESFFDVAPKITHLKYRKSLDGASQGVDTKEPNTKTEVQTNETVNDQTEIMSSSDPDDLESHSVDENIEDLEINPLFSDYNDTSEATNNKIILDTKIKELKMNKSNNDSNKTLWFEVTKARTTQANYKQENVKGKVQDLDENKQTNKHGTSQNYHKEIIQAQANNVFDKNTQSKNMNLNEELTKNENVDEKFSKNERAFYKVHETHRPSSDFSTHDELTTHGNSNDITANNMEKYNYTEESKELIHRKKRIESTTNKHYDNIFEKSHSLTEGLRDDINTANQEFLIQRIWNLEHELEAVKHKIYDDEKVQRTHNRFTVYKNFDRFDNVTTILHSDENEASKSHITENPYETTKKINLIHDDLYWHPSTDSISYNGKFMNTNNSIVSFGEIWRADIKHSELLSKKTKSNILMPSTDTPKIFTLQQSSSNVSQDKTTTIDTYELKRNFDSLTLVPKEVNDTTREIEAKTVKTLTIKHVAGSNVKTTKATNHHIVNVETTKATKHIVKNDFRAADGENKTNTYNNTSSKEHLDSEVNNITRLYDDDGRNNTFNESINPEFNDNNYGSNNTVSESINLQFNNTRLDEDYNHNNSFGAFWSI